MKASKKTYKFFVEIRQTDYAKQKHSLSSIEYHAVIKSRNGEIVFTGETRKSKSALIKTMNRLFPSVKIVDKTK